MNGLSLKNHFTLNSSENVKELCKPLFDLIGVTYFNYIKIYNSDCSRELLTNNADWIEHFYSEGLYNSIGAIDVEHLLPKGYFLWSELDEKDPVYLQGRDFFNIDNGISFVIKREDVTYLYIFASKRDRHEINNFYSGNIDIFQRFIHYFNDSGRDLIKEVSKNRIYLPEMQEINKNRVNNIVIPDDIKENFFEKTKVNRYFLLNESDDLFLTERQAKCASLLVKGYTSKEIAREMNISFRTVEGYSLDVRNKIQEFFGKNFTKLELLKILKQSNIK